MKMKRPLEVCAVLGVMALAAHSYAATGTVTYNNITGDLIATSDMGLNGVFIGGVDLTGSCVLCNNDLVQGFGTDSGINYSTILGYSGVVPTGNTQWLMFNLMGTEGADFTAPGITLANDLTINFPGDFAQVFTDPTTGATGNFFMQFGDLTEIVGKITKIPEPASGAMIVLGLLGMLGLARKRR